MYSMSEFILKLNTLLNVHDMNSDSNSFLAFNYFTAVIP